MFECRGNKIDRLKKTSSENKCGGLYFEGLFKSDQNQSTFGSFERILETLTYLKVYEEDVCEQQLSITVCLLQALNKGVCLILSDIL